MMFDLVVKNGRIVTSDQIFSANIGVKGETIAAIFAPGLPFEARDVVDAKGKYVFPGGIDSHAHLNDPGYNWREDYTHGTA